MNALPRSDDAQTATEWCYGGSRLVGLSVLGGFDESYRACGFALCGLRARDRADVGVPVDTQGQRAACLLRQDVAPDCPR